MEQEKKQSEPVTGGHGVGRRPVVQGIAWSVPAAMVASAAPAFASSGGAITVTACASAYLGDTFGPIVIQVDPPAAVDVLLTVASPFYFSGTRLEPMLPAGADAGPGTAPVSEVDGVPPAATLAYDLSARADGLREYTVTTDASGTFTLTDLLWAPLGSATTFPAAPVLTATRSDSNESDTCALQIKGNVAYAWGYNANGQVGNGTATLGGVSGGKPVEMLYSTQLEEGDYPVDTVSSWAAGGVITNNGRVYTCGYNAYGALGDGTTTSRRMLVPGLFAEGVPVTGAVWGMNSGADIDALIIRTADDKWYASGQHRSNCFANGVNANVPYFTEIGTELTGAHGNVKWVRAGGSDVSGTEGSIITMEDGSLWVCGQFSMFYGPRGRTDREMTAGSYEATLQDNEPMPKIKKAETGCARGLMALSEAGDLYFSRGNYAWDTLTPPGYVWPGSSSSADFGFQKIDKPGPADQPVVDIQASSLSSYFVTLADGTMWAIGCNGNTIGGPGGGNGTGITDSHYNEWLPVLKDDATHFMTSPDDYAPGGNGTGFIVDGQYYFTGNNREGQKGDGSTGSQIGTPVASVVLPTINGTAVEPLDTAVSFYDTHIVLMKAKPTC